MEEIVKEFGVDGLSPQCIYLKQSNQYIVVPAKSSIRNLINKETYYVLNVNEQLPKKQEGVKFSAEMEVFFDKLKSEQLLEDDEVQIIKDVFADQKIKFKMLKKITDEKLKGYGSLKNFDGLRMAILDLIENL